MEHGMRFVVI